MPTDRSVHVINLSLPKSGSTSLAAMFPSLRTVHEFDHQRAVDALLDAVDGGPTERLDRYLIDRDREARPNVDSGTFMHLAAHRLPILFPAARFVIVLRQGVDWAASFLGMLIEVKADVERSGPHLRAWVRRYAEHVSPTLARLDLSRRLSVLAAAPALVEELAEYWGAHTIAALRSAPPARTLVIDLASLDAIGEVLAEFAGVPREAVAAGVWANRGGTTGLARNLLSAGQPDAAFGAWTSRVRTALDETGHRVRGDDVWGAMA